MDVLLKTPAFIYNSRNREKLVHNVKGLLILHTVLNCDVKEGLLCHTGAIDPRKFTKCGWANAVKDANASYKQELLVEKPGKTKQRSPSPELCEESSDDECMTVLSTLNNFNNKKVKLAI